jgi:hypothetical protein
MPTPPENHSSNIEVLTLISNAMSSFWAWLLPMLGGIWQMGKLSQRINQMEQQTSAIMDIKLDVKELKTKVDMLLKDRN